ncbi:MAG: penicillin-binding protein 2 [Thermodesulfobacteriota bacterium]
MKTPRKVLGKIARVDETELSVIKKRMDVVTVVVLAAVAILVARLWFLQIHKGPYYQGLSERNRIRIQSLPAPRGNILDHTGRPIVTNRPSFNVVWYKEDAPDQKQVIKDMAALLGEDITTLLDRVRLNVDLPKYVPVLLAEDIDWQTLSRVENQIYRLPGVQIEATPARKYLFEDVASHLIGYLGEIGPEELKKHEAEGYRPGDQIGKMGLEKQLDLTLHGEKGEKYLEVDVKGFEQQLLQIREPLAGNDVQLTLDIGLQQAAEEALAGKAGAVVAMEVDSGRLLVLASSPPYPLSAFKGRIDRKTWEAILNDPLHPLLNKTIQGQYPPGSTYKIVTALAGLSEGLINPETTVYCGGSHKFGNRRYGCWKKTGHGTVSLHRALAESCDVYFYILGQKLGVDRLARYAKAMGLGEKTGIILEHEKAGVVPTEEWKKRRYRVKWQEGETLSVAIGQGFNLVTPLQLCIMTAATANGGKVYRPGLVERIFSADGEPLQHFEPEIIGELQFSPRHLDLVRQGLIGAVNEPHGTASKARLKGITVAGKTGTAQVVHLAKTKGTREEDIPYKYRDHAWFTCFAPAEAPKIAVAVLVEHGLHGGSAAAPVAKQVLLRYFNLPPEDENKAAVPATPSD